MLTIPQAHHHTHRVLLPIVLATSYSLSSSPCLTRYRPHCVLLTPILTASYSLSYSPYPTRYRPHCRHPHCHPPCSCHAHRVVLIALCLLFCAHRIVSYLPTFLCFRHTGQCYVCQNSITTCDDRGDECDTGCLCWKREVW